MATLGSQKSTRQQKIDMSLAGLVINNNCAGEGQQKFTRPY
jgi:hypothetical protein